MTDSNDQIAIAQFGKFLEFKVELPKLLLDDDNSFSKKNEVNESPKGSDPKNTQKSNGTDNSSASQGTASTPDEKNSLQFKIIIPISTDPHPFVLAILATVVATVKKIIERCDQKKPDISITFLDWGNVLIDQDFFRKDLIVHYELLLKDKTPDSFQNLNKIRYYEFQTSIKNIFASIQFQTISPTELIEHIRFEKYYDYKVADSDNINSTINDTLINDGISEYFIKHKTDFENEDARKRKEDLFKYTDKPHAKYSVTSKFIAILNDIGKNIDKESYQILILPDLERKIIQKIIEQPFLDLYKDQIQKAIKKNLATFNEISLDPNVEVPKYYNLLSQYQYSKSDMNINSLYFATVLRDLQSPLFLPNVGIDMGRFYKHIIDEIRDAQKDIWNQTNAESLLQQKTKEILTKKICDLLKTKVFDYFPSACSKITVERCDGVISNEINNKKFFLKIEYKLDKEKFLNGIQDELIEFCKTELSLILKTGVTKIKNSAVEPHFDNQEDSIKKQFSSAIPMMAKEIETNVETIKSNSRYEELIIEYYKQTGTRDMEDLTLSIKNGFLKIQYQMSEQFKLII